jgi:hypothetical protein
VQRCSLREHSVTALVTDQLAPGVTALVTVCNKRLRTFTDFTDQLTGVVPHRSFTDLLANPDPLANT